MRLGQLKALLKKEGIWRCEIVQSEELSRIGVFELHVPTTSKVKVSNFIYNHIPMIYRVEVREMKNPLKHKKYTYISTFI